MPRRLQVLAPSPSSIDLGRVDGFDQDEAESKRDERAVILRRLGCRRIMVDLDEMANFADHAT